MKKLILILFTATLAISAASQEYGLSKQAVIHRHEQLDKLAKVLDYHYYADVLVEGQNFEEYYMEPKEDNWVHLLEQVVTDEYFFRKACKEIDERYCKFDVIIDPEGFEALITKAYKDYYKVYR